MISLSCTTSSLAFSGLELLVNLGWPAAERSEKQSILVDITIAFSQPPLACMTDNLEDTYCYDALIIQIKQQIEAGSYRLIEHLGYEIYCLVKRIFPHEPQVTICINKKPPVLGLTGGVAFYYGDKSNP